MEPAFLPVIVTVVYVAVSLLVVGLNVPLALGRVPPNDVYGFRTPKTVSNPAIWYPANRACGRLGIAIFLVVAVIQGIVGLRGHPGSSHWLLSAVLLTGMAVWLTASFVSLRRIVRGGAGTDPRC